MWQELQRLEENAEFYSEAIGIKQRQIEKEKMEIAQNAPKNDLEPLSQKVDKNYEYPQKVVENRKESVSQAEFDAFIYKTIKNAERPKLEHERKIEEWEKSLKQLKSTYASYNGDLERLESEKWGMLGLYQSKEQKAEIERIKGLWVICRSSSTGQKAILPKSKENRQNH